MIVTLTDAEKSVYRDLWRPCLCAVDGWGGVDSGWMDIPTNTESILVLTAYDPYGLDLSDAENVRLDRKFGEDVKAEWWRVRFEETHRQTRGYLFDHTAASLALVHQAGQLAAFLWIDAERHLLWNDGTIEPFPYK